MPAFTGASKHGRAPAVSQSTRSLAFEHDRRWHSLRFLKSEERKSHWRCSCGDEAVIHHKSSLDAGEARAIAQHRAAVTGQKVVMPRRPKRASPPKTKIVFVELAKELDLTEEELLALGAELKPKVKPTKGGYVFRHQADRLIRANKRVLGRRAPLPRKAQPQGAGKAIHANPASDG
jgi:hypothetical protein